MILNTVTFTFIYAKCIRGIRVITIYIDVNIIGWC